MQHVTSLFLTTIFLLTNNITAQEYIAPLDINLLLSGTFGELRNNHFHAGIDIKTDGVEGQRVKAIADGYVSRIKVSTWGYGKAIYITHPKTGHTSVYAHLKKFSKKINKLTKEEHYKKEKFEINFFPEDDALQVKQGELIGLSGNSGGSNGAHLHFEIRDSHTQHPINPLKFGFKIDDNIAPKIKKIKIYPSDTTLINGYNTSKIYLASNKENSYSIKENPTINGSFSLGVLTYDQAGKCYNKNGIYEIKLYVDGIIHYQFKVDELNFQTTRYINAHVDYCEKIKTNDKFHRCYKLPNNELHNYSNLVNNGIISFNDTLEHEIELEISDIYKNISKLSFKVKSTNQPFLNRCILKKDTSKRAFEFSKENLFVRKDILLHMKPFSLYESIMFNYKTTDSIDGVFGKVHHIHFNHTPVHKKYALALKTDIPTSLKEKAYIATTDMKGNFWHIGGIWNHDYLKTKTKEFGDFCIVTDTIKPEIIPINISPGKILTTQKTIKLNIKDIHSGIKYYRGEIDGKWILMDYDHKRNLLRWDIQENIITGDHTFILKVVDNVGNTANYKADFTY